jgi:hypothetical protein
MNLTLSARIWLCSSLLLLSPSLEAETVSDSTAEIVPLLQGRYVDYAGLQVQPNDRLGDLLRRSQGGMSLTPASASPAAVPPILAQLLPGGMIYCRVASFNAPTAWTGFVSQLRTWAAQGAQGVILDLRSNAARNDFDGAAQMADLFVPPGTPLFTLRDARQNSRSYTSPLNSVPVLEPMAILTDNQTSGAAEALAACLKANGALTLGRPTAGNGAEFEDHPLASGQILHYIAGQVFMADGTPLWRHPVEPDIGLAIDAKKEETVLALIAQNRVLDVIGEAAGSHRLSEAALVRGEDPEVEAYLVPHDKAATAPVPQDSALVAALDSLKAIHISQGTPPKSPSTVQ